MDELERATEQWWRVMKSVGPNVTLSPTAAAVLVLAARLEELIDERRFARERAECDR